MYVYTLTDKKETVVVVAYETTKEELMDIADEVKRVNADNILDVVCDKLPKDCTVFKEPFNITV